MGGPAYSTGVAAMTEREMLLRAVCENPDDDTPRLVFADWLDENGEPERAEFIRTQVSSERIGLSSEEGDKLFWRERELLSIHEGAWRSSLPRAMREQPFIRGFVESAELHHEHLSVKRIEYLFRSAPIVSLSIPYLSDPGMLARVSAISRLKNLSIGLCEPTEDSIAEFLTKADLGRLETLTIYTGVSSRPRPLPDPLWERMRERFRGVWIMPRPD